MVNSLVLFNPSDPDDREHYKDARGSKGMRSSGAKPCRARTPPTHTHAQGRGRVDSPKPEQPNKQSLCSTKIRMITYLSESLSPNSLPQESCDHFCH